MHRVGAPKDIAHTVARLGVDPDAGGRVAVVPVRRGELPAGGLETVAEAGGEVVLVGDSARDAAAELDGIATRVQILDLGAPSPGRDAAVLAPLLGDTPLVLLPASADGRDLAPRLAAELERPLHANAMEVRAATATLVRHDGAVLAEVVLAGPCVITLQPGVRTVERDDELDEIDIEAVELVDHADSDGPGVAVRDAESVAVLAPDVTTMDLSEAPRILGGGAGLDSAERFDQLAEVAARLGASMGATRVITDRGWLGHSRQIGTTGVVVDPVLYISFGISGAVQHTAGLGSPDHIITVNTDPHCPMMEMADLAIVAEANQTLEELAVLLADGVPRAPGDPVGDHGDTVGDQGDPAEES